MPTTATVNNKTVSVLLTLHGAPSHNHCHRGKAIAILIYLPQTDIQNILSVFMALVESLSTPVQRGYLF